MALFDPDRTPEVAPEDAVAIAHAFMIRCRAWATDVELPRRRAAVLESDDPEHAAKLHQWLTWLAFTDHALRELEEGRLDHWFSEP